MATGAAQGLASLAGMQRGLIMPAQAISTCSGVCILAVPDACITFPRLAIAVPVPAATSSLQAGPWPPGSSCSKAEHQAKQHRHAEHSIRRQPCVRSLRLAQPRWGAGSYLADAFASTAPGGFQHDRVSDLGTAGQRLVQRVYARLQTQVSSQLQMLPPSVQGVQGLRVAACSVWLRSARQLRWAKQRAAGLATRQSSGLCMRVCMPAQPRVSLLGPAAAQGGSMAFASWASLHLWKSGTPAAPKRTLSYTSGGIWPLQEA